MKAVKKPSALEGIKKEQLKRRVFTLDFKAEVVRHRQAGNLSFAECGRKFEILPKLIQDWEKQYEAGQLTAVAGRRAVSPEQAENARLRAELSRARISVAIRIRKPPRTPKVPIRFGFRTSRIYVRGKAGCTCARCWICSPAKKPGLQIAGSV